MTKKFVFKATKDSINVDKKAYTILKSYTRALHIIYKNQPEIILDFEKSFVRDLKHHDSIDQTEICQKISALHNLDNSKVVERAVSGGFDGLGSNIASGFTLLLIVMSFNSATLYLFSLPLALVLTSLLLWLLSSKSDSLTTYFVSNIASSSDNEHDSMNSEMIGGIKNPHIATLITVVFKAITVVMRVFLFWYIVSGVSTYISILMYKFGVWPVTLMVQTNAYALNGFVLFCVILLSSFALFGGVRILLDFLKEIKYGYFNAARFVNRTAIFALLLLVFIASNHFLDNQPANISSKSFGIASMEKLVLLNNSLCSSRYNVIVQKNNQNSIIMSGDNNKVQSMTLDSVESGLYTVTNIYPFQSCVTQKPIVTIVVNSNKGFVIDRNDLDNESFNLTLVGFENGEVSLKKE